MSKKNKPISKKQLMANRKNARLGGVKTQEGKQASRLNARKHGVLSNILTEEDKHFFEELYNKLCDDFLPNAVLEHFLVERICWQIFKLKRLAEAEKEYFLSCLHEAPMDTVFASLGEYKFQIKPDDIVTFDNVYQRYETTIENRLYKALNELRSLKQS